MNNAVEDVLKAAEERVQEPPGEMLKCALAALKNLSESELKEAVMQIAAALPKIDSPGGAGFLAVWLGAAVEKGADPEKTGEAVLETLLRWSKTLPELPEDEEPSELAPELVSGLEMMGRSMVAHLSMGKVLLDRIRNREDIYLVLKKAADWSAGPMWVMDILKQKSGDILLLHGIEQKGFIVTYQNLSNCFHFFTLLQGALQKSMPGSQIASSILIEVAKGQESLDVQDEAWWHYAQASSCEARLDAMIYGEASLDSIGRVDGLQVVLLWPPILQNRAWNNGFFGPILKVAPPDVSIKRELLSEEVIEWRRKLSLPEVRKKAWWRFF